MSAVRSSVSGREFMRSAFRAQIAEMRKSIAALDPEIRRAQALGQEDTLTLQTVRFVAELQRRIGNLEVILEQDQSLT